MIIGIDLGTTNSACAIWRDGKIEFIPNRHGDYLTPSAVSIDSGGKLSVGKSAGEQQYLHPKNVVTVFKRYMGSERQIKFGGKIYNATELSGMVVRALKEDAECYLGTSVSEAVISVPAYFNDTQRRATKQAAEFAGLNVLRLINEPTAAAVAYGLHHSEDGARFIVLDIGGGTFDVSVMEYFDGVLEVHASSGDNYLGGEDFLDLLYDHFLGAFNVRERDLSEKERVRVRSDLERAKRQLSSEPLVRLEGLLKLQSEPFDLTRSLFEDLTRPLMARIQVPIERALYDSGTKPGEVDDVILVGGASRMPQFRSFVAKLFKRMPSANIDPDLVVAYGAGLQAGLISKDEALDDVVLTDVSPFSLGVEVVNQADSRGDQGGIFSPIIERNTVIPASKVQCYCTIRDQQDEVLFRIYQGESRLVRDNIYLGELSINVPKNKAGCESAEVRFSYDMNGILEVDVLAVSTGEKTYTLIENASSKLTEEEIEESKKKLASLKFHPREDEANITAVQRAERLYESSLGEVREYVSQLITEFEGTMERQNTIDILRARKELHSRLDQIESERWL